MEPSDSESEPERYNGLSRHYIEMADEYLRLGDRVQASEKGWGAVAEAMKSIAEERGWNHNSQRLLNDVAFQLSEEWVRPDLRRLFVRSQWRTCTSTSTKTIWGWTTSPLQRRRRQDTAGGTGNRCAQQPAPLPSVLDSRERPSPLASAYRESCCR